MTMSFEGKDIQKNNSSDEEIFQIKKNLNKPNKQKSEFEEKIRVGKDYQVVIPDMNPKTENYGDKALLVWSPAKDIPESKIDDYIELAKERYGYNVEQALGMLFWHKHDLQKAVLDLQNFTPFPDEWTTQDKILFEQAYQFHGKSFHRIRQMLPDKSIASLVKFYYSWKKAGRTRSCTERHEKKHKHDTSENGGGSSENGSPNDSDIDDKNDSTDNDVKEMGDIEEIIGVNNKDNGFEPSKSNNKTSIMTTSGNRAVKRRNDDDSHGIADKKFAAEKILSDKPEITITLKGKESTDVV